MHCSAIRQAETDRKPVCEPDFVKKEEAMRKSYEMDMTRGPLLRSILIFTLPLLLSGVLQLLFNATDIVVVGQFAGANAMASVGSTTSLFNLLINAFIGISVGANVLVARYCGEKNYDGVQQTVQTSLLTGLVGGVILVVLGIVLARPMLTLMKTPDEVIEGAVLYMRVYFIGMPATMIYNFGAAVLAEQDLNGYIQPTKFENIDIIVADVSMGTLDMALFTKISRENIVRSILRPVVERGYYDYILIDTNPNLSLLNFNIVNASHYVLIPAQPASFDLDGLAVVLQFVEGIKPYNPTLQVGGIIINRYDARNRLITEAAMDQLRESYSELLFEQIIRVDSRLQNAQWENRPVLDYAGSARISKEYRALTKEILKRCV